MNTSAVAITTAPSTTNQETKLYELYELALTSALTAENGRTMFAVGGLPTSSESADMPSPR